jgi:hypothetical protein
MHRRNICECNRCCRYRYIHRTSTWDYIIIIALYGSFLLWGISEMRIK